MVEFSNKATTLNGQTVEGLMEGKEQETVVQHLHQLGYIPIRILSAEKKEAGLHWSSLRLWKVGIKELLIFTQELSTLVSAGLPIDRSFQILGSLTEDRRMKETVIDVLKRIEGGSSLSEALRYHPRAFQVV